MKRRLILMGCVCVVVALCAWMAFAYIQGSAPFSKPANGRDLAATDASAADQFAQAASASSAYGHKCDPASCQKCPSMKDGKCTMAQGQQCPHEGSCVCPGGTAQCKGMQSGACGGKCAGNASGKCAGSTAAAGTSCPGATQACAGKAACGSTCPLTK
jgi:hypothetical protein